MEWIVLVSTIKADIRFELLINNLLNVRKFGSKFEVELKRTADTLLPLLHFSPKKPKETFFLSTTKKS
jgi:hypothetical protein